MRIGELAARTDVTVETLRYYEQRRLLKPSRRRSSGYREYSPDAVALVRFIKRAQSHGFTLTEVQELVRLRERAWSGDATLRLREAVLAKVRDIDRRMRELRALGDELGEMIRACDAACAVPGANPTGARRTRARVRSDVSLSDAPSSAGRRDEVPECPLVEALDTDAAEAKRSAPR
jgi:DNA-binding transcriptional MerR regulator